MPMSSIAGGGMVTEGVVTGLRAGMIG